MVRSRWAVKQERVFRAARAKCSSAVTLGVERGAASAYRWLAGWLAVGASRGRPGRDWGTAVGLVAVAGRHVSSPPSSRSSPDFPRLALLSFLSFVFFSF